MKQGSSLAGSSKIYDREKHDFYEPCVGQGHIADVLKEYFPKAKVLGSDIVDRGYPNTLVKDFSDKGLR